MIFQRENTSKGPWAQCHHWIQILIGKWICSSTTRDSYDSPIGAVLGQLWKIVLRENEQMMTWSFCIGERKPNHTVSFFDWGVHCDWAMHGTHSSLFASQKCEKNGERCGPKLKTYHPWHPRCWQLMLVLQVSSSHLQSSAGDASKTQLFKLYFWDQINLLALTSVKNFWGCEGIECLTRKC